MKIFRSREDCTTSEPGIVTVGTFDGVHLGHREILRYLKDRQEATGFSPTVVTFDPHPQSVVRRAGKEPIRVLTTTEEKLTVLEPLGIERVFVIPFTEAFRQTDAATFVQDILLDCLGVKELVVGWDHAFGKNREGTFETLQELGRQHGFSVDRVAPVFDDDTAISSTRIREAVKTGDVAAAGHMLGAPYFLTGIVARGDGRGRSLGFPTANIEIHHPRKLTPAGGVFIAEAVTDAGRYPAMVNIGIRPTFDQTDMTIEAHLLNFDGDLYQQTMRLEFYRRQRDEQKFNSVIDLQTQLAQDRDATLNFFENN
jgi:riboflavin kinase / FMN adenylyltransferase